jgi:hypothetical protein
VRELLAQRGYEPRRFDARTGELEPDIAGANNVVFVPRSP